jgi:hypothetical protein
MQKYFQIGFHFHYSAKYYFHLQIVFYNRHRSRYIISLLPEVSPLNNWQTMPWEQHLAYP